MTERVQRLTMSVAEAAEELGISTRFAYDLTHTEDFPAIRIGHRTRVSCEGLREWVLTHAQNKKAVPVLQHQNGKADKQIEQAVICPNYTR